MDTSTSAPRSRGALTRHEQAVQKYTDVVGGTSLNRQKVLSEEEYTEALERIIARDFFPGLHRHTSRSRDIKNELRRGLASDEVEQVEQSVRRIQEWMDQTPAWDGAGPSRRRERGQTPTWGETVSRRGDETPILAGATPLSSIKQQKQREQDESAYDINMTLDEFQQRYTSEDNASFAAIMSSENAARRTKYAWAFKAEQDANDKARRALEARTKLVDLARRLAEGDEDVRLIEGAEAGRPGERLLIEGRQTLPGDKASIEFAKRRITVAPSKDRLLIEGSLDGALGNPVQPQTGEDRERELQLAVQENEVEVEQQRRESKDAGVVQAWPTKARNGFFFAPDANIAVHEVARHPLSRPPKTATSAVDELGIVEPKGIRYGNTRLFSQEEVDEAARKAGVPASPSHSNIAAAISGTPYLGRTSMTPRVQGYSFVDTMPSPSPSQLGENGIETLMTFGTLASTPIALRDPNAGDPVFSSKAASEAIQEGPFKIPQASRREFLAHKMASKATKSLQQRHGHSYGNSGLGLRKNSTAAMSPRARNMRSVSRTPGDWDVSAKDGETPARDAFLSPAAKNLLGRTANARRAVDASPFHAATATTLTASIKRTTDARDRMAKEKLKRAKWDPSPISK